MPQLAPPGDADWPAPATLIGDEPDWADPFYAEHLSPTERLAVERTRGPAGRDSAWLAAVNPNQLDAGERLDLLTALDEQVRWLQAAMVRTLATIAADDSSAKKYAQESVSLALRVPVRTAQNRLRQARTLVDELPATLDSLSAGQISHDQARTLTDAVWKLSPDEPELVRNLEQAVLGKASLQTTAQFRAAVKRAAVRIDPASAEQRHVRAQADRTVRLEPADDGMALLSVLLPAPDGQAVYARLTAAAARLPSDDERTLDQRRTDILVDVALAGISDDDIPGRRGRTPSIHVVVSADTLLDLDDEPAELVGHGPITAEMARRLAADESSTWRRLLTDPNTGELLDISPDRYRPSPRLRAFIQARDGVCAFPTCNQPGYRCEFEHIVPFGSTGRTCRCNGALACRRHNQCKVDSDWKYSRNPDGSFSWTSPEGRTYRSSPARTWTTRAERPPQPAAPRRLTTAELWQMEDARHRALVSKWQAELAAASSAGAKVRARRADEALAAIHRQRRRELAHRADPSAPPY